MSIRIILVDDHQITRQGLLALLEKRDDMKVIAEANNGRKALDLTRLHNPDVVVMDISMPDLNGIDATHQIKSEFPMVKVIALTMHTDRRYIKHMLKAGVSGYLLKSDAFEELVSAIKAVTKNQTYLGKKISDDVITDYIEGLTDNDGSELSVLTPREREVLQLIAQGLTTVQISTKLFISPKTVSTHRNQIMAKLNLHSVAELTKFAIKEGLTSLE